MFMVIILIGRKAKYIPFRDKAATCRLQNFWRRNPTSLMENLDARTACRAVGTDLKVVGKRLSNTWRGSVLFI